MGGSLGVNPNARQLDGLWRYVANSVGGTTYTAEQVARMATLVLLPGPYLPAWDGLWAAVSYGYEGGTWSAEEVKASCRHITLGGPREGEAPAADFYLWAGGRFRIASPNEIDLEQFWQGQVLGPSLQLGLYRISGERLTLCLSESGGPRPTRFDSEEHPSQYLGQLVRQPGSVSCSPLMW